MCLAAPPRCGTLDTLAARLRAGLSNAAQQPVQAEARLVGMLPYTVFVLLPLHAAIVMGVYRRNGLTCGAHFVFSLHMHSVWFAVLLAMALAALLLR